MADTSLSAYVGAEESDAAFVAECAARAEALVNGHIGTRTVPEIIKAAAVLEVGADLFHRRMSRNGIATFGTGMDISPMRVRSDPLAAARPILAPYLGPGIS